MSIGGTIGAVAGGLLAYAAPAIGGFLSSSFSVGIPGLAMSGGGIAIATTITVTGTQIAATAALGLGIMFFAKGSGSRMGHNQYENKQFKDVMKKLGIDKKNPKWRTAHDALDGTISKFQELLEYIKTLLGV